MRLKAKHLREIEITNSEYGKDAIDIYTSSWCKTYKILIVRGKPVLKLLFQERCYR